MLHAYTLAYIHTITNLSLTLTYFFSLSVIFSKFACFIFTGGREELPYLVGPESRVS